MHSKQLDVIQDERGLLYEAFRLGSDGQVFIITIKPGHTRGNHYHTRKIEKFLVIFGSAEMAIRDRKTNETKWFILRAEEPVTVTVTPNNTHSISASEEGCMLVCWVSEQFDEEDNDTYPEEV